MREWKLLTVVAVLAGASAAYANIYPAGLRIDDNDISGTCENLELVYFLNETADGDGVNPGVRFEVLDKDNVVVRTITLDRQNRGRHLFVWDGRDNGGNLVSPSGNPYRVRITAADRGYTAWTQISSDSNRNLQFEQPRGIAVNKDPSSPYYGRIYVTNTRALPTVTGRPMGDGFYMINPDFSSAHPPGQEDVVRNGGRSWAGNDFVSPYRLTVGPDNRLYIGDWSDPGGGLYRADPDINVAEEVLAGTGDTANPTVHGSIAGSPIVLGSIETSNLQVYAIDEDLVPKNNFWLWNIGAGPLPWNTPPNSRNINDNDQGTPDCCTNSWLHIAGVLADADRGPDGKFYLIQRRSDGNQVGLLVLVEQPDGSGGVEVRAIWDSLRATRTLAGNPTAADQLRELFAVAVSPDGSRLGLLTFSGQVIILPLVGGIPDLANRVNVAAFPATNGGGRDIAWDAAGNFYVTSNIQEVVRVFSPPGGPHSNSTTSSTFTVNKSGTPPTILQHPADQSVCPGGNATFSVTASGATSYQWRRDGIPIPGATSSTLALTGVTAAQDGGVYTVEICGPTGVVVSNPAILNVGASFITIPLGQTACVSEGTATFTASARGVGTLNYVWMKGGTPVPGASGTASSGQLLTLNLTGLTVADNNSQITVEITDSCGTITSPPAVLNVRSGPVILGLCCNRTVNPGSSAIFSITATGKGQLSYQWKTDLNGNVSNVGGNSSFLTLTNLQYSDNGLKVFCVVTDECGTTTSGFVTVTVNPRENEVGFCANGIDDDADNLTDCDDSDCIGDPACACPRDPFADADSDGDVDQIDFGEYQLCYTGAGDPMGSFTQSCRCFDRDNDQDVDATDFVAFEACWSGPSVPANAACDNP